jgi:polyhydroxyalkanoate synthesis regulator phasin
MASSEERLRILQMIQSGKITPEEGVRLLEALEKNDDRQPSGRSTSQGNENRQPRWMRVVVTDLKTNREKVNIRLPANVIDAGYKMGARYTPNLNGTTSNKILEALRMGETGKVIDVCDNDACERVVITFE